MKIIPEPLKFEWDKGNIDKNLKKHNVTNQESEEAFISQPIYLFPDEVHTSLSEKRYMIWGESKNGRKLAIIFTIRSEKIRVISARDMNKKERREYEERTKANTKV